MITGTVVVDIRDVDEGIRAQVWRQVGDAPRGVRVVLLVGTTHVSGRVVEVFRVHRPDLDVDVQGSAHAVRRWVDALRNGWEVD